MSCHFYRSLEHRNNVDIAFSVYNLWRKNKQNQKRKKNTDMHHFLKDALLLSSVFARTSPTVFPRLVLQISLWYNNKRREVKITQW